MTGVFSYGGRRPSNSKTGAVIKMVEWSELLKIIFSIILQHNIGSYNQDSYNEGSYNQESYNKVSYKKMSYNQGS